MPFSCASPSIVTFTGCLEPRVSFAEGRFCWTIVKSLFWNQFSSSLVGPLAEIIFGNWCTFQLEQNLFDNCRKHYNLILGGRRLSVLPQHTLIHSKSLNIFSENESQHTPQDGKLAKLSDCLISTLCSMTSGVNNRRQWSTEISPRRKASVPTVRLLLSS